MDTVKITIGIPTYSMIHIETTLGLIYMLGNMPHCKFNFAFHKGTYVHELRNAIVKEAIETGSEYLFFLDSDLSFQVDGLEKLLSHKKDIIGGCYNMKQPGPPIGTIKMKGEDGKLLKLIAHPADQIFKCYSVATGFLLIRLDAIKDMKNPFDFDRNEDGSLIGEDVNFCKRCGEAGLEIWCDPTIKIGHIGEYLF